MEEQPPRCWQRLKLGDAVTLQRGKDLPVQERTPGSFPVIGSSGIVGYHSQFVAEGPGVMVGRSGSVGSVMWQEDKYWPLNTALWVTDFHGNDPRFVFYFLEFLDLGRFTAGVSVPTLNRNTLHPLDVKLPCVREQRAIAEALDAVQKAKEARQRELALERERKAALMEHLFTHGTCGEPTKQTEIGEIPESWHVVKLGEIAHQLRSGITPTGGERVYLKTGIPLIRSQNVLMNRLSLQDVAFISPTTHNSMAGSAVQPGDVLLNITGASIGRVTFVPDDVKVANVNQHVCRIRLAPNANPAYASYYLSTPRGQAQVMGFQFGTTRQGLNYGNVRAIRIPIPSLGEQWEISNALLACDGKTSVLQREDGLHDELFRAMLEELMTGRLSATPLIEEHQPQ